MKYPVHNTGYVTVTSQLALDDMKSKSMVVHSESFSAELGLFSLVSEFAKIWQKTEQYPNNNCIATPVKENKVCIEC